MHLMLSSTDEYPSEAERLVKGWTSLLGPARSAGLCTLLVHLGSVVFTMMCISQTLLDLLLIIPSCSNVNYLMIMKSTNLLQKIPKGKKLTSAFHTSE
jgi:hypothetical protein